MRKNKKISSAKLWNNAHKLRFAMYHTLFGVHCDMGNNYPITSYIVANKIDIAIVVHSLKNLESMGNESARELLFNQFKSYDLTINFEDLLQELRIVLLELESVGELSLIDGQLRPTNMDDSEFIKTVYGCVTKYLYANKTRIDKKHIDYEMDENTFVSMFDRKSLSNYIELESINTRSDLNQFRQYVISASHKQAIKTRLNIIDGLIDGLTYKEINARYNIPIGTIGDNVSALKRLYKECFNCSHEFKEYTPMTMNKAELLRREIIGENEIMKGYSAHPSRKQVVYGGYVYETTKNRDLLANINYIIG